MNYNEGTEFIMKNLSKSNYVSKDHPDGIVPTCSDVFKSHPILDGFEFIDQTYTEVADNCVIIHVPYFSREEDTHAAEDIAKEDFKRVLKAKKNELADSNKSSFHVVINYHGNPYPKGMGDKKVWDRTDYNLPVIRAVTDSANEVLLVENSPKNKKIKIICSHLHKSNPHYEWKEYLGAKVELFPLGIEDAAGLNTRTGEIEIINL
jgi:hypothetical protein